ncbi:MAG TPA: S8 family serine peptidase [Kofleriaceae bacterium]|nr:S8 family serine peptidase [Kofleriaceae bacterium]
MAWQRTTVAAATAFACACGNPTAPASDDATTATDVIEACAGGRFRCFALARAMTLDTPSGYAPLDLQSAYAVDVSRTVDATVAVVDAYGYPMLEGDLAAYRGQFGLPPCTVANGCLTILNQDGETSPLPDPPPAGDDWTIETALDVDMASAGCPSCKILVVQADDDGGDGLDVANDVAAASGATVISNSWGGAEGPPSTDSHFTHPGIAIFASTGDGGYEGSDAIYPASSANVIAVGGTSLERDPLTQRGWRELAWDGAGAGCSASIAKPSWQTSSACATRMIGDVSAVAAPATGVAVSHGGGWTVVGGTSASSPLVAAIFAQTGHGAATPELSYDEPAAFFDVTSGTDGVCGTVLCSAAIGWDGPTGNGTPNGAVLIGARAPTLAIARPFPGQVVPPGFTVDAECTSNDAATVADVEFNVGTVSIGEVTAAPYTISAPPTLPDRGYVIVVTCTTSSFAQATQGVAVTQLPGCTGDADCPDAIDVCYLGACISGSAGPDGLGASCLNNTDCDSGECATDGASKHCIVACELGADACPAGFACEQAGSEGACWPIDADADLSGGGCDASGHRGSWLGAAVLALALRRRRRRS